VMPGQPGVADHCAAPLWCQRAARIHWHRCAELNALRGDIHRPNAEDIGATSNYVVQTLHGRRRHVTDQATGAPPITNGWRLLPPFIERSRVKCS
jgi:hypothetical protein